MNHKKALKHLTGQSDGYPNDSEMLKRMLEDPRFVEDYDRCVLNEIDLLLRSRSKHNNDVRPHPMDPVYEMNGTDEIWLKRGRIATRHSENLLDCLVAFNCNWNKLVTNGTELSKTKRKFKKECVTSVLEVCFGSQFSERSARKLMELAKTSIRSKTPEGSSALEPWVKEAWVALRLLVNRFNKEHGFDEGSSAELHMFLTDPSSESSSQRSPSEGEGSSNSKLANIYSTLWFYSHQRVKVKDNSPYGSDRFIVTFLDWLLSRSEMGNPMEENVLLKYWVEKHRAPVFVYGFEKTVSYGARTGNRAGPKVIPLVKLAEHLPEGMDFAKSSATLTERSSVFDKCFGYLVYHNGMYDLLVYTTSKKNESVNRNVNSNFKSHRNVSSADFGLRQTKEEILAAVDLYRYSLSERKYISNQIGAYNHNVCKECSYCRGHDMWHQLKGYPSLGCKASLVKKKVGSVSKPIPRDRETTDEVQIAPKELASVDPRPPSRTVQTPSDFKTWVRLRSLNKIQLPKMFHRRHKGFATSFESDSIDYGTKLTIENESLVYFTVEKTIGGGASPGSNERRRKCANARLQGLSDTSSAGYWKLLKYKAQQELSWSRASMTFADLRRIENDAKDGDVRDAEYKTYHFVHLKRSEPLVLSAYDVTGAVFELKKGIEIENVAMKSGLLESLFGIYERTTKREIASTNEPSIPEDEERQLEAISKFVKSVWNAHHLIECKSAVTEESNLIWNLETNAKKKSDVQKSGKSVLKLDDFSPLSWLGKEEFFDDTKQIMVTHCGMQDYKVQARDVKSRPSDALNLSSVLGLIPPKCEYAILDEACERSFRYDLEDLVRSEFDGTSGWAKLLDGIGRTTVSYFNLEDVSLMGVGKTSLISQRAWKQNRRYKNNKAYWRANQLGWMIEGGYGIADREPEEYKCSKPNFRPVRPAKMPNVPQKIKEEDTAGLWGGILEVATDGILSTLEKVTEEWDADGSLSENVSGIIEEFAKMAESPEEEEEERSTYERLPKRKKRHEKEEPPPNDGAPSYLCPQHFVTASVNLPIHANAVVVWSEFNLFQKSNWKNTDPKTFTSRVRDPNSPFSEPKVDMTEGQYEALLENWFRDIGDDVLNALSKECEADGSRWKSLWLESLEHAVKRNDRSSKTAGYPSVPCYVVGGKTSGSSLPVTFTLPVNKTITEVKTKESTISSLLGGYFSSSDVDSSIRLPNSPESGPKYKPYGKLYVITTHDLLPHMVDDLLAPEIKKCWKGQQKKEGDGEISSLPFKMERLDTVPRNMDAVKSMCQHSNESIQNLYSFYAKFLKT